MADYYLDSTGGISWPTSTLVSVGDRVWSTTAAHAVVFECTTGGTTGGTEPTWDTTVGNTTNDNGVVWTTRDFTTLLNVADTLDRLLLSASYTGSGDEVLVRDDHVDPTVSSTKTWPSGGSRNQPVPMWRIDDSGNYSPTTGSDTVNFKTDTANDWIQFTNWVVHGIRIQPFAGLNATTADAITQGVGIHSASSQAARMISCDGSNSDTPSRWRQSTFTELAQTLATSGNRSVIEFELCDFVGTPNASGIISASGLRTFAHMVDFCDFTGLDGTNITIVNGPSFSDTGGHVVMKGCIFPNPAGTLTLVSGFTGDGQWAEIYGATDAGDIFKVYKRTYRGEVMEDEATYITTGGYVDEDQSTNMSQELVPDGTAGRVDIWTPLESFLISTRITSTGSTTLTVRAVENYSTGGGTSGHLDNSEIWVDFFTLQTSASGKYTLATTRVYPMDSPSDPTNGSLAEWTGEPASSRAHEFAKTITINKVGLVFARVSVGLFESGASVFVNPVIDVT